MPVITEDTVRRLAQFRGERAPVTSCYLDVDGRRFTRQVDVEHELDSLLRRARAKANGTPSVHEDLHRIESFVHGGFDRSGVRGLAIFSCSAEALWEVVALPVRVRSHVVINHQPAVSQLESVVHDHESFGVLLVDRQRTRLFRFELGELTEHSELVDELPRDYDDRGLKARGETAAHVDALAHQHARRAAHVLWEAHQQKPFDHLAIGGPDDVVARVEAALHPYLRDRCCSRINVSTTAPAAEIRDAALDLEQAVSRKREAALVGQLREQAGGPSRAVTGLMSTLEALTQRRVSHLLVSEGFSRPGWRCDPCGWLSAKGPKCPLCVDEMERVDDVVEEAIEVALSQSCAVDVCTGNADLDVAGRIGALLRY